MCLKFEPQLIKKTTFRKLQAFADYQTQQMTSNFVDHFGFSEEEISEQEESLGYFLSRFTASISIVSDIDVCALCR